MQYFHLTGKPFKYSKGELDSRKKVSTLWCPPKELILACKEAAQRNVKLRDAWVRKMAEWSAEQVVFLDESGVNAHSGERAPDGILKGQIIPYQVPFTKRCNFNIFPLMTVDGYIAYCVYPGTVNGDTFNEYVETQLLPHPIQLLSWTMLRFTGLRYC